jgi:ribA/ribD-fused uncharacterized protein
MGEIRFYDPGGPVGWLSNFSLHELQIDDEVWPSVEHYYQAQKFSDRQIRNRIRLAITPSAAKEIGQRFKTIRLPDWGDKKEAVMMTALRVKFAQHAALARLLVETKDVALIEDSIDDYFWGVGKLGNGRNRLGELLMRVRAELRSGVATS